MGNIDIYIYIVDIETVGKRVGQEGEKDRKEDSKWVSQVKERERKRERGGEREIKARGNESLREKEN